MTDLNKLTTPAERKQLKDVGQFSAKPTLWPGSVGTYFIDSDGYSLGYIAKEPGQWHGSSAKYLWYSSFSGEAHATPFEAMVSAHHYRETVMPLDDEEYA